MTWVYSRSRRKSRKGWDRFISELRIAINFYQPLLAVNRVAKKRRSFSKVLSSSIHQTEDVFVDSLEPLARIPKWLAASKINSAPISQVREKNFPPLLVKLSTPVFPFVLAKPSHPQPESHGPIISAIMAPPRSIVTAKKNIFDTSSNPFGTFNRGNLRTTLEKLQLEIGQCLSHLESSICRCGSVLLGSGPPAGKASNNKFQKGKAKAQGYGFGFGPKFVFKPMMKG